MKAGVKTIAKHPKSSKSLRIYKENKRFILFEFFKESNGFQDFVCSAVVFIQAFNGFHGYHAFLCIELHMYICVHTYGFISGSVRAMGVRNELSRGNISGVIIGRRRFFVIGVV